MTRLTGPGRAKRTPDEQGLVVGRLALLGTVLVFEGPRLGIRMRDRREDHTVEARVLRVVCAWRQALPSTKNHDLRTFLIDLSTRDSKTRSAKLAHNQFGSWERVGDDQRSTLLERLEGRLEGRTKRSR